ncbi:MAG TPA: enolase C-terminal domain-like protein [Burkholderiales bacterium]|nr:enolase C-terminal domain-like protein [Burkholderiales bacterium]
MKLAAIAARTLQIPFNVAFRHASAERSAMQSLWVEARAEDGTVGYGEGCPREYVTSESLATGEAFVQRHAALWMREIGDASGLFRWVADHRAEIDRNPAAWAAVEIALLDLIGKTEARSVEAVLGLPELSGHFRYTAVLGDMDDAKFALQLAHYRKAGFGAFKIKLAGERARDRAKVTVLRAAGLAPDAVRADANNLWRDPDEAVRELRALNFPFFALEEPLAAGDYAGMARVASDLGTNIILDESLLRLEQLARLPASSDHWIANVRISKMGGVLRSLEMVRALRERGVPVIVGAHVGETSLLTRAGLTVANAARDLLIGQEGAFGTHLLCRDVVEPPLMFGPEGMLDSAALPRAAPGLGLAIRSGAER